MCLGGNVCFAFSSLSTSRASSIPYFTGRPKAVEGKETECLGEKGFLGDSFYKRLLERPHLQMYRLVGDEETQHQGQMTRRFQNV